MLEQKTKHTDRETRKIALVDGHRLKFDRPLVMGIINVTPDSFSNGHNATLNGGKSTPKQWAERARTMENEGADIIDIGGESTRPGAKPVSADKEMQRVLPVIEEIRKSSTLPISIDTYKSETARAALDTGADIINDISASRLSPDMAKLAAEKKAPLVLMHMLGTPQQMQKNPHYDDCVAEIGQFFEERINYCLDQGVDRSRLILDPGIGFGKRLSDNIEILAGLRAFGRLGLPLLVGTSRKSFINMLHPTNLPANQRIGGSVAAAVVACANGADILRVHDVRQTVEALKVFRAVGEIS